MECKDTYIGNNLIKGISGGEMKRTSIGIELLINPSILFLDEPTTGLDSKTALDLIHLLNNFICSCPFSLFVCRNSIFILNCVSGNNIFLISQ